MSVENVSKRKIKAALTAPRSHDARQKRVSDIATLNPLGDVLPDNGQLSEAISGFDAKDLAKISSQAVPPWQLDTGQALPEAQAAPLERRAILNALTQLDRFGVIIDQNGTIVQGNTGWTQHVAAIPALQISCNKLVPTSQQSQQEFVAALALLFSDYNWTSVPVALRDLDGWVTDIIHIKRVGASNPNRAYALLPKSSIDVAKTLDTLSVALSLTPLETNLVLHLVKGESDQEIAALLTLKPADIKRAMRELVSKFRVRHRSHIVRIITSFP